MFKLILAPWKTIWDQRDLLKKLSGRRIELRHRGSLMGMVWMVLDPILILCVYLLVFGYIFQGQFIEGDQETPIVYGITIFLGLSIFRLFSEVISTTTASVVSSSNYVKRIVFPLEILPLIEIATAMYSFFFTMIIVSVGLVVSGLNIISTNILLLPFIFIPFFMLLMGIGWILSALNVYIRDMSHTIQFISISMLFGSAIFYPVNQIPESFWSFLKYNPILHFVESVRCVIIWQKMPQVEPLLWIIGFSGGIFYAGYGTFRYLRKGFADVL